MSERQENTQTNAQENVQTKVQKIAVATEAGRVSGHFGHCEQFHVFEVAMASTETGAEKNEILQVMAHDNPGHRPGFLPKFLHELGVHVIISGGMGGGAIDLFAENGIAVVLGAQGDARQAVEAYISGNLTSTGSVCNDHAHHGTCGGH